MDTEATGVANFLSEKTTLANTLFREVSAAFQEFGDVHIHATKTMIVFSARINFAYIIQIGKDFIDLVLPFKEVYEDNLCFKKIKHVPGSNDYNHHIRLYAVSDLNEEVKSYMLKAYQNGR